MTNTPQPTQTHAPQNAICSICGYNIAGVVSNDENKVTCPECGTSLKPAPPETLFTKSQLNKLYLRQLILPGVLPCIPAIICMPIFGLGMLAFLFFLLAAPFWYIALYINATLIGLSKSKPYPRPCTRWHIPLIALLASLPAIASYFGVLFLGEILITLP